MKVSEVLITPELATEYLKKNTNNRPLNTRHIKFLAEEILSCRWRVNGDAIRFSGDRLIDGQHRLHAVIVAGIPIKSVLVNDIEAGAFETIDCGKKRDGSDALGILGEKNATCLSAAVIFVHKFDSRDFGTFRGRFTPAKIVQLLNIYGEGLRQSVAFVKSRQMHGILVSSVRAGLHFVFSRLNRAQADNFFDLLFTGANLSDDSPILILRQRLVANASNRAKLPTEHIVALCVLAWNCERMGKKIKLLRWQENSAFPMPI